jgi:hypothetical protein
MKNTIQNTQTSYDQVAGEYAEKFKDEMDDKPFDRDCLDRLAREVRDLGPIWTWAADRPDRVICTVRCGHLRR